MKNNWLVPVVLAIAVVVIAIAATQHVRFNCVDLGFYKSCGVSQIK